MWCDLMSYKAVLDQGWRKLFVEVGVSLGWLCRNCCFKSDKALTWCWCWGGDWRSQKMCVHFICDFSALGFRSDRIFNPLDKGGVVYTTTLVGQKNIIVINSLADHYQFLQDQIQPVPARALPLLALLSFALSSRGELASRNRTWTRFHITILPIQLWSGFVWYTMELIKIRICWRFLFPYQRLPTRTVPTAMRRITTKDKSKLFSSSAVLGEGRKWSTMFTTCMHCENTTLPQWF